MGRAWDLEMVFEGAPVAQGRVRAVQSRRTGMVRMHTPRRTEAYRRTVRLQARMHLRGLSTWTRLAGALSVDLRFYLPRPKRLIWKKRPMYAQLAPVTPDITNLAKCIEDALNKIAWKDDSKIVHEQIYKIHAAGPGWGDPRPRVELRARVVEDLVRETPDWKEGRALGAAPFRDLAEAPRESDRIRQAHGNAEDQYLEPRAMIWILLQAADPTLATHTIERIQEGDAFAAMAQFLWVLGILACLQFGVWIWITVWIGKRLEAISGNVIRATQKEAGDEPDRDARRRGG